MGRKVSDLKALVARERAAFADRLELADEIAPGMAEPCLLWTGGVDAQGHGMASYRGRRQRARRVAHQLSHSCVLASDVNALPRCGVKLCVHPSHVELVDDVESGRRANAKRRADGPRLPGSLEAARRALERAEHERDLAERRAHAHRANVLALEAAESLAS